MSTSVLNRYLKTAMDGAWEETKHHRADDGRFTSGSGRGKTKETAEKCKETEKREKNGGTDEITEDRARKIVRKAFEDAKCELKSLKLVAHHLRAEVKEADEGSLDAINGYLTKRGLKAKIQDKTTYRIAEDGFDDIQFAYDPMLAVLIDLCKIDMLAKDLHYRAKGKPFYGLHELADLVWGINRASDDINEVYYMGEKGTEPPERAFVAGKAAELVGQPGGEDELLAALTTACTETVAAVDAAKKVGVASGTAAVLDDISKRSLQAKGLLMQTLKNSGKTAERAAAIDSVIGKGFYFKPEAVAADSGTHEGAVKAAQTRKAHGGGGASTSATSPASTQQITEHTHTPDQLKAAIKKAPMIGGKGSAEGGVSRSILSNHSFGRVLQRNGGNLPVGARFVDESGNVGAYMGQRKMSNGLTAHTVKMANGTVHSGIAMQMPNLYLAREVGKYL